MRPNYSLWMCATLAALLSACATTQQGFEPTERVQGRNIEGYREAFYDLEAVGVRYGEVKVWSRGARRAETSDGERTVVQVGFTVDDTGQTPLRLDLDQVSLESYQGKHVRHTNVPGNSPQAILESLPGRAAAWRYASSCLPTWPSTTYRRSA